MEAIRSGRNRTCFDGQHLKLTDLKEIQENGYLSNRVPKFPHPEFHLSRIKHDTNGIGLQGIRKDSGFRGGKDSLLWWSLAVGPDDIQSAETRLLERNFPDRTEQQVTTQRSFLWKFASSPSFTETSRVGSYRFTFPLKEVLKAYSKQFCRGAAPVMRVYKTSVFKSEVQYTVLVHSPFTQERFSQYPLLKDNPKAICVYRDCCSIFIWRPEAICKAHRYELKCCSEQQMDTHQVDQIFYVWDQVAIALHVENLQILNIPGAELRKNLTFCWQDEAVYALNNGQSFDDFDDAKNLVTGLWPNYVLPLEEELSMQQKFSVSNMRLVLIGRRGVGKSSSAGIILDTKDFIKSSFASSGEKSSFTTQCRRQSREVFDRVVTIVDTPGLPDELNDLRMKEISKCIQMSAPGPHAFLLVMRKETVEAQGLMQQVEELFGENVWRYTIILFTCTDLNTQIQLCKDGPERQKVEDRHHVININRAYHRDQVLGLLTMVEKMMAANGQQFYLD